MLAETEVIERTEFLQYFRYIIYFETKIDYFPYNFETKYNAIYISDLYLVISYQLFTTPLFAINIILY